MNDDAALGMLPRFVGPITILSRGIEVTSGGLVRADHCVLRPFSGVLDVSLGPGRVPTLDLSYLTLEPLVARAMARSAGSGYRSRTDSADTPSRQLTETDAAPDRSGEVSDELRPEPRVRDVVHDQRPAHREEAGQPGTPDADGSTRTHLDLYAGRQPPPERFTDTPGEPDQDREASGVDDRRTEFRPATGSEPTRTTLDHGPGEPPPTTAPGESVGLGGRDTTPASQPSDRRESNLPESRHENPQTPDRVTDPPTPDRTVIDRSWPTPEAADVAGGQLTPPDGEGSPSPPSGVEPPRMVARRQPAEPGRDDARTVDRERRGSAAESVDAVTAPDRTAVAGDAGSIEASASGATGPSAGPSSPRMVVDRGEASADDGRSAAVSEDAGSTGDDGDADAAHGPRSRRVDSDGELDVVKGASTDPESRLVDRLYRALQEREAIERRRRGDR